MDTSVVGVICEPVVAEVNGLAVTTANPGLPYQDRKRWYS